MSTPTTSKELVMMNAKHTPGKWDIFEEDWESISIQKLYEEHKSFREE